MRLDASAIVVVGPPRTATAARARGTDRHRAMRPLAKMRAPPAAKRAAGLLLAPLLLLTGGAAAEPAPAAGCGAVVEAMMAHATLSGAQQQLEELQTLACLAPDAETGHTDPTSASGQCPVEIGSREAQLAANDLFEVCYTSFGGGLWAFRLEVLCRDGREIAVAPLQHCVPPEESCLGDSALALQEAHCGGAGLAADLCGGAAMVDRCSVAAEGGGPSAFAAACDAGAASIAASSELSSRRSQMLDSMTLGCVHETGGGEPFVDRDSGTCRLSYADLDVLRYEGACEAAGGQLWDVDVAMTCPDGGGELLAGPHYLCAPPAPGCLDAAAQEAQRDLCGASAPGASQICGAGPWRGAHHARQCAAGPRQHTMAPTPAPTARPTAAGGGGACAEELARLKGDAAVADAELGVLGLLELSGALGCVDYAEAPYRVLHHGECAALYAGAGSVGRLRRACEAAGGAIYDLRTALRCGDGREYEVSPQPTCVPNRFGCLEEAAAAFSAGEDCSAEAPMARLLCGDSGVASCAARPFAEGPAAREAQRTCADARVFLDAALAEELRVLAGDVGGRCAAPTLPDEPYHCAAGVGARARERFRARCEGASAAHWRVDLDFVCGAESTFQLRDLPFCVPDMSGCAASDAHSAQDFYCDAVARGICEDHGDERLESCVATAHVEAAQAAAAEGAAAEGAAGGGGESAAASPAALAGAAFGALALVALLLLVAVRSRRSKAAKAKQSPATVHLRKQRKAPRVPAAPRRAAAQQRENSPRSRRTQRDHHDRPGDHHVDFMRVVSGTIPLDDVVGVDL